MVGLLDVNTLVALAWPNHVQHERGLDWFERHQHMGWATCPVSQSGFIRVSSNHRVLPHARTPYECLLLLRRITALPHHVFWTDDIDLTASELVAPERLQGYRQVTDAHLLAIALRHEGRLVTFDRGLRNLVPETHAKQNVVTVIE